MKPQTIGRVLGIGVRVAGRMAGQRLAGSAPGAAGSSGTRPAPLQGVIVAPVNRDAGRETGRTAGRATGNLARGVGGFFRPFSRLGNILFLEVVGVFFFVFVLFFGSAAWRARASYAQGPHHPEFLGAAALMLVFLYLSVSSFVRARRK